ncbi:hypothetical protein Ddye_007627 [Dipteronia dyeriana]|uniref:Uncharacterized protein n=1 Tax=Dipteronia dyeriana TaxID=168575 RepID=A0AAD9XKB2_9ROSI|nr:hypothetical protein Ddye_007627 [Dipteronia dyeriana]
MKFLTPVTFYKEVFKDILMNKASKHGRLLGLDVSDNYVSLADIFQSLVESTHSFIDSLCKTGKLDGFKHTYWDNNIRSKNSEFVLKQHVQFIVEHLNQPQDMSKTIMDKCRAVSALQGFLDCTNKMVAEDCD